MSTSPDREIVLKRAKSNMLCIDLRSPIPSSPLFDRVTTAFHARAKRTIESVDEVLLLRDGLLITCVPRLARLTAANHGPGNGANSRARACIARDRADRRASGSTAKRAACPFA